MSGSRRRLPALSGLLALGAFVCDADAARAAESPEDALRIASSQIRSAAQDVPSIERAVRAAGGGQRTAEQRIADAVLLMGVKDYERAADVLHEVVEKFPHHPTAFADGLNLLGETYFLSKQFLSARRAFQDIVNRASEQRFAPFRERAVVRLVDIAVRLRDWEYLDKLVLQIGQLPSSSSAALSYAKGKGHYARGKLAQATAELGRVPPSGEFAHQARYLLGLVAMKEAQGAAEGGDKPPGKARYGRAVDQFREVTKLPADSPEHRHVIDLAWLAIGRLLYESNQWSQAVDAYNRIGRDSPEFGTMLYELAWVYVKLGDFVRAQRALEVLAVAAPNSPDVADAQLLRADLMLRAGQFEKSLKVYESVRATYDVMRERVDAFLRSTNDPGVYFDTLSQDQLELFDSAKQLPPLALQWAREGEHGATAFAIIDDVATCRRLIKQSNEMIERLNAVLTSPNKVRALPGLKAGAERAIGLINSIGLARMRLAHGMDETEAANLSRELLGVRQQRRALERRLGIVPVTSADFAAREREGQRQWNKASQQLQRLELEVDTLQATINGLERILQDAPQTGVVRGPEQMQQFRTALDEQRRLVAFYREQVSELRRLTEAGKMQVGFGDARFVEDAQVRKQYAAILWRETQLAQAGGGGAELAAYAARIAPVLQAADGADARLEQVLVDIDRKVAATAAKLRETVQEETQKIVEYSIRLEQLDREARVLVGEVAMYNFQRVHSRLRDIVLRADVGITEEAWEVREEQQTRVQRLKVEKSRNIRRLEEELNEVLDDSGAAEEQ
jgi:tetratricopeptide (TPR) repeat protein